MKKTASVEEVVAAAFPATPENRYKALLVLEDKEDLHLPDEEPLLLTMGEAAKLLGLSRSSLWRLLKRGRLEKIELYENSYRLRRSDVVALAGGKGVSRG